MAKPVNPELAALVGAPAEQSAVLSVKPALQAGDFLNESLVIEERKHKILPFGHTGGGKTFIIVGLLLAGERVQVFSSDFGGEGLNTVQNELQRIGRTDLLANIRNRTFSNYGEIERVMYNLPEFIRLTAESNAGWLPTVLYWDGFSGFQLTHVEDYVLSMAPMPRKDEEGIYELRHKGLWAERSDWFGIQRATIGPLQRFLTARGPNGENFHRFVSCLEGGKTQMDKLSQKLRRGTLIQGAAESLIGPAFDLIIECYEEGGKYFYRCKPDGEVQAKSRGYDVPEKMEADPLKLWQIINKTGEKK